MLSISAHDCTGLAREDGGGPGCCGACKALEKRDVIAGIQERILGGVSERSSHLYQPIAGLLEVIRRKDQQISALRINAFSATKTLIRRAATLDLHKKFMVAVASGKVPRVDALVRATLKSNGSIGTAVVQLDRAINHVYTPRSYLEADKLRGVVFLKLGGARVADFAHRTYGSPSVSTLRQLSITEPLVPSPSAPTFDEICKNISISFPSTGPFSFKSDDVRFAGAVLMIDEVKCDERLRWDPTSNKILGVCREHSATTSLDFMSMEDLDRVYNAINAKTMHRATEVRPIVSVSIAYS